MEAAWLSRACQDGMERTNLRDLTLLAALLGATPLIWRSPIVGIVAWIWIALMNPQREVYGFLAGFGANFYIAILTIFAWVSSRDRKFLPLDLTTVALILFSIWICVTTYFALDPKNSQEILNRTLKTMVLAFMVLTIVNSRYRMQSLLWAYAISLGYFAVKGGGFFILTGGKHNVYGPENSMIQDNNNLGIALILLLPLLQFLGSTSALRIVKLGCLAVILLTCVAIIGTYSRGALLALGAVIVAFALRSRTGVVALVAAGALTPLILKYMPARWLERMATIGAYHQDESFEGRVAAWRTSFNIANERIFGGGFKAVELDWVATMFHSPGSLTAGRAAHSIFFEVLGEHGYIGLGIYILILVGALYNAFAVEFATRRNPNLAWENQLARMFQVSLIGFLVGGAALSMAYYDGFIVLLVMTSALANIVNSSVKIDQGLGNRRQWTNFASRSVPALAKSQSPGGE